MKFFQVTMVTIMILGAGANVFALSEKAPPPKQNGGVIYQKPVDKIQDSKDDQARRSKAAQKKTEELNKKWKAQQRKAAKAAAKAKAEAEKKKKKAKSGK